MRLPAMIAVRQRLAGRALTDVGAQVREEIAGCGLLRRISPGARIGLAVGSRGVANLPVVIAAVIGLLREAGAKPVIIPAMGSHGGATPAGQRGILASLGVTAAAMGAPVRASMAVEQLGQTASGVPIWFSREALRCDGVIVVNRVKHHTDFRGPVESGLMKMIAIGLGKRKGAAALHSLRVPGLRDHMPEVAREILRRGHILGGIALVENGDGQTVRVAAARAPAIEAVERQLLRLAGRIAPRLPFDEMEVLIVDWMGKEISGIGMDPAVIGRMRMPGEMPELTRPRVRNLVALRLTPASHGNGLGVGFAEFIPRALADAIDWGVVKTNSLTSGFLERTKLPLVMESDREAIAAAATVGQNRAPQELRILRIRDTSHVGEMWISPALEEEARGRGLEILGPAHPLRFDQRGALLDLALRG